MLPTLGELGCATHAMRLLWLAIGGPSVLSLQLSLASPADERSPLFNADGYRVEQFRDPVPERIESARIVHTDEVRRLTRSTSRLALIDVMPAPQRPQGLADSAFWLAPVRNLIPSSVWLPNVGYGHLSDDLDRYFRSNLERLTGGDMGRPLIIYCDADCWMSWNAARRAAAYGYTQVMWYPEGISGWEKAGLPLTQGTPVPAK